MNVVNMMIAGSMMVSLCSGALVQKEVSLLKGQGIDISANQSKTVMANCPVQCDLPSHCDTLNKSGVDLAFFATGVWDNFDCGCGGDIVELMSDDTIRMLKKTSSLDLSKPLTIADTAHVSVASQTACSLWVANCPDTHNPCFPCSPGRSYPVVWNLGKTHERMYFLFRSVANQTAATINYILQTDGSLDFKGATVAVLNPANRSGKLNNTPEPGIVKRFGVPTTNQNYDKMYDVCGRLINTASGAANSANRAPMVFIVKKTNGKDVGK